jgi:Ni/Fe-hydrogenase 1 B-type cytochrome subunit
MATMTFRRVYVWEWPVRFYHWVTVASITALVATGLVIGDPPVFLSARDASASYWFGIVRFLHFAAGFVFLFVFVLRAYWMFAGNTHASWRAFLPVTSAQFKRQFREVLQVIRVDVLQLQKQPVDYVGHNALAAWSYCVMFAATVFVSVTGLALYAPMSDWWFPHWFVWVTPLLGGDAGVRFWHHAVTWVFILFTLVHLYLAVFHEGVEAKGEISSIISGTRFLDQK